jgi:hypothetical protein
MLDAYAEERSREREWIALLVATIINLCTPNKLKKRIDPEHLLPYADRQRALKRQKAAIEAERRQAKAAGRLALVKSDDWGEV